MEKYMNDQVKYSLAGFCMGVAELIPGISRLNCCSNF